MPQAVAVATHRQLPLVSHILLEPEQLPLQQLPPTHTLETHSPLAPQPVPALFFAAQVVPPLQYCVLSQQLAEHAVKPEPHTQAPLVSQVLPVPEQAPLQQLPLQTPELHSPAPPQAVPLDFLAAHAEPVQYCVESQQLAPQAL